MTSKLPVVGSMWGHIINGSKFKIIANNSVTIKDEYSGVYQDRMLEEFLEYFEELPDSNPQEVSEVDRALEELKREIALCGGGIKPPETEGEKQISRVFYYFLGKAQNLVNALEAEKTERAVISKPEPAVDENEQAYYEAISKYAEGIKAHSFYPYEPCKCCSDSKAYADYMSKPEPKIDIKEERVDLASIWKPESEFNKGVNDGDKIILLKLTDGRVILTDKPYEIYGADKFCRFTDLVKSFEQMQKDINELKNGGK
jgi:hypothetical protein